MIERKRKPQDRTRLVDREVIILEYENEQRGAKGTRLMGRSTSKPGDRIVRHERRVIPIVEGIHGTERNL